MYASKSTRGFYDPEYFGCLLIVIQDPEWIRPMTDIVLLPGESAWAGEELLTNLGDEPQTFSIPDMNAIPDTVEVANPACSIPADAVEISAEFHAELLAGQSGTKVIAWGNDGYPFLGDMPPPSPEELAAVERVWRDGKLAATDGVVSRHRDELEEGITTTLTVEQYTELQVYRRQLRDWPQTGEFPLLDHRPPAPEWLAEYL
jgi:hypothetical protein